MGLKLGESMYNIEITFNGPDLKGCSDDIFEIWLEGDDWIGFNYPLAPANDSTTIDEKQIL